jgi:hypothetical protein
MIWINQKSDLFITTSGVVSTKKVLDTKKFVTSLAS